MKQQLTDMWTDFFRSNRNDDTWWRRKQELFKKRGAEIITIHGRGHLHQEIRQQGKTDIGYHLHLVYFIKQNDYFYREEQVIPYQFQWGNGEVRHHQPVQPMLMENPDSSLTPAMIHDGSEQRFSYDRLAAVKYAERWWNSYNPDYKQFDVDCTNFISQSLHAGGAPMHGAPNRNQGWWYQDDNWSYSWSVAHSFRWYMSGATNGLKGTEVESASDLKPGDVICYDFEGDGKWDHTTIVVANDNEGMPLVNAHTDNSRHRYWSYEDSIAWTPKCEYKFFQIGN
ncbi:amidase domain-containing protein [Oceanobacillus halotolerans]|uniref:amidase domain-containing protein n=1 Tax=Oceanobacillus halotolerans TaxID=2663380 RepID=UPI001969FBCA|nr:amidase domain-containing protein [Oceanobacillus halotolerans]